MRELNADRVSECVTGNVFLTKKVNGKNDKFWRQPCEEVLCVWPNIGHLATQSLTTVNLDNYFASFKDEYTNYCSIYLIQSKSNVGDCFLDYVKKSENEHSTRVLIYA